MSLDDVADRIKRLQELEDPSTTERRQIESYNEFLQLDHSISAWAQKLVEDRRAWATEHVEWLAKKAKWELTAVAKAAQGKEHPRYKWLDKEPQCRVEFAYHRKALNHRIQLLKDMGEIPENPTPRTRPAKPTITYPAGHRFVPPKLHEWFDFPPNTLETLDPTHRSRGPGENDVNGLARAIPAKGGLFDNALPCGEDHEINVIYGEEDARCESGETKAPDPSLTFRGGAEARMNINQVADRVKRITNQQLIELTEKSGDYLPESEVHKLEYAMMLIKGVKYSIKYGNMGLDDWNDFYNALGILNRIDWNGTPQVHQEDPLIRDSEGNFLFERYINHTMRADKCFDTTYIFLVRPVNKQMQCLIIPKVDYAATIKFVSMSKYDAYFEYRQPLVTSRT